LPARKFPLRNYLIKTDFIKVSNLSKHNFVPFVELEKAIEKLRFGTVSIWLQVHDGRIVAIQGNQFQRLRFKKKMNTAATAVVLAEIKDAYKKKKSGNLTFTIKFGDGHIRELYLQRNYRKIYPLK